MSLCHYGYQTYLSTQPISNMSLKNMSLCHYGLTSSIPLCHSVCILYLYMYEKTTRYQWFEEKLLSLQQNQLS